MKPVIKSCLFLLPAALLLIGCFDDSVRLYVKIDGSCSDCCDDQEFKIYVGGYEEKTLEPGGSTRITRETGTGNEVLEVWIIDKGKISDSSAATCQACIQTPISDSGDHLNSSGTYALYDDDIAFSDEDIHATISCEALD